MVRILFLILAGFCTSCMPSTLAPPLVYSDHEPMVFMEETVLEVAVLPNDLVLLDVSRWGRPESQRTPQDRLLENIDQMIERERQSTDGDAAWREAELSSLKGDVITGIAYSDALDRLAEVVLKSEETAQEGAYQRLLVMRGIDDPREKKEAILNYYITHYGQELYPAKDLERDILEDAPAVHRMVNELCDMIDKEAWQQGFKTLLHSFVMKNLVLRPALDAEVDGAFLGVGDLTGYCQPERDEFTGKFFHSAHFTAQLVPLRRMAGVIDALHDDLTMAGMGSRAYVTLLEPEGFQAPLPVLIVQHQKGLAPGFVRVVGSGVITQIFGNQGQLEILESTREVFEGDHFFIVQVHGRLVQDEDMKAPFAPGVWRGMPTETVRPAMGD